jgi:plasmid stability protein
VFVFGTVLEQEFQMRLLIKDVPEHVVQRVRTRAVQNYRSLQRELLAIIEQAVDTEQPARPTIDQLRARIRASGLTSRSEAAAVIRADRDAGSHGLRL